MARSDTLRREIASQEDKKAGHAKVVAAQEKIAAAAREASRKKREQAGRSKVSYTVRSALSAAEREAPVERGCGWASHRRPKRCPAGPSRDRFSAPGCLLQRGCLGRAPRPAMSRPPL
jgi:hypothetical protein